jgi:hypothetical protein
MHAEEPSDECPEGHARVQLGRVLEFTEANGDHVRIDVGPCAACGEQIIVCKVLRARDSYYRVRNTADTLRRAPIKLHEEIHRIAQASYRNRMIQQSPMFHH